jgi:hypothetical protein
MNFFQEYNETEKNKMTNLLNNARKEYLFTQRNIMQIVFSKKTINSQPWKLFIISDTRCGKKLTTYFRLKLLNIITPKKYIYVI